MRLKPEYIYWIKKSAEECFGKSTSVYLFGSRTDDSRRGGDIDLFIETEEKENLFERKLRMLQKLYKHLGEQKIDIVINNLQNPLNIYSIAKNTGLLL